MTGVYGYLKDIYIAGSVHETSSLLVILKATISQIQGELINLADAFGHNINRAGKCEGPDELRSYRSDMRFSRIL